MSQQGKSQAMADLATASLQRSRLALTLSGGFTTGPDGNPVRRVETFHIRPLTVRAGGRLGAFISEQGPPRALEQARESLADAASLPADVVTRILEDARLEDRAWPPSIVTDPEKFLRTIMESDGGMDTFLSVILHDCRPDLSEKECLAFVGDIDYETTGKIIGVAMGGASGTPVSRKSNELLLVGPKGIEAMVRATASLLDVDPDRPELAMTVDAIKSRSSVFGVPIPLVVEGDEVEAPKAESGKRRPRSAS